MNIPRLTPTPEKPVTAPAATRLAGGRAVPSHRAVAKFTQPATRPLIMAICTGSAEDSLRVRLLSMPQNRQAASMKMPPVSR